MSLSKTLLGNTLITTVVGVLPKLRLELSLLPLPMPGHVRMFAATRG